MKLLIARLHHETNTFSPVPTPLAAFGPEGPCFDDAARRDQEGMRTAMAAFIALALARGASMVTPVSASANPSGPVQQAAYEELCARIVAAAPGCDAALLDLHGAMVAEDCDDGEGELLARLRAAVPGLPIAMALDLHANVTERMVANADVIVGFKTYPHVDMAETGHHAGRLLLDNLAQPARRPRLHWRQLPLMSHTLRSGTASGAMARAVSAARQHEAAGHALAVSVFAGFSLADIAAPCMSVVAVEAPPLDEDGTAATAAEAVRDVADQIWRERAGFIYRGEPLARSIARAKALAESATRPVLLLDHGDNCMSGGSCDTLDVLVEALAQGLDGLAAGPLCDPGAVAAMFDASPGATLTLDLGHRAPLAHIGRHQAPVRLSGTVLALSDGWYTITGPTYTGQRCCMGRTALFDIGAAQLVVSERPQEPWDLGVFGCVGLDPTQARFLLLKSRMYCRPVFEPLACAVVECDSGGVTSSDYRRFHFQRLRRPVYPLDALSPPTPAAAAAG